MVVPEIDIEDILSERSRRQAEVHDFTETLPSIKPFRLPTFVVPLPRGADEHASPKQSSTRTEFFFATGLADVEVSHMKMLTHGSS